MATNILAAAASSWAVLMGLAPLLQIRRMLRERSSGQVSVGSGGHHHRRPAPAPPE